MIHPPYRVFYGLCIAFCAQSAARSIEAVADLMEQVEAAKSVNPLDEVDPEAVLNELQNVVLQGAAVSRYFWPVRDTFKSRGEALRTQYGITEQSPLRSRDLRNAIEHFDERLDEYLSKGIVGTIIPHYLGPTPKRSDVPRHFFRAYFVDTGVFEMLGQQYEIEPLSRELWLLAGGTDSEA